MAVFSDKITNMSTVTFQFPSGETNETESYTQLNLLAHAQIIEKDIQSRCGGHAECGTCRVIVISGKISPIRDEEQRLLDKLGVTSAADDTKYRLACQCYPESDSDLVIQVPSERFRDARTIK